MDPYRVLGISSNATEEEIKAAYRERSREYLPENFNGQMPEDALEKMKEINAAYDEAMRRLKSSAANNGAAQAQTESAESAPAADYLQIRGDINNNRLDNADAALDYVPENQRGAEWYFLKGSVMYKRGWYSEALRYFSTAHTMEPKNREYKAAFDNAQRQPNQNGYNPYAGKYNNGPYTGNRNVNGGGCSACDMCQGLICADCCCECMGGDLISCC